MWWCRRVKECWTQELIAYLWVRKPYEVSHLRSVELSTLFTVTLKTEKLDESWRCSQQLSRESTAQIRKFHFDPAAASHKLNEDTLQIILSFNARTKRNVHNMMMASSLFLCQHNIFWNSKHHQFVFCQVRQRFYHKLETIIAHFVSAFCVYGSTICTDHFSI